jgi:hypothetical protein
VALPGHEAERRCGQVLAASLSGDVAGALREHVPATLDEHCCYFHRPDLVLVSGDRDLSSRGITDCPMTAITVTFGRIEALSVGGASRVDHQSGGDRSLRCHHGLNATWINWQGGVNISLNQVKMR